MEKYTVILELGMNIKTKCLNSIFHGKKERGKIARILYHQSKVLQQGSFPSLLLEIRQFNVSSHSEVKTFKYIIGVKTGINL